MAGRRFLVALGVGVFAALVIPAPAHAHAALMHTSPAAGAILDAAPAQVVLRFSETVRPVAAQTKVLGPGGVRADAGTPEASGLNLVLRLASGLPKGSYLVSYRIVSVDGHPVAGGFPFSVGVPSTGSVVGGTPAGASAEVDPLVGAAMPVARFLSFAGLPLLVGPALLLATLWPVRLSRRGPGRLLAVGAVLLASGTAGELYLQAPYASGDRLTAVSVGDVVDVLDSRVGIALLVRLGTLAVGIPLLVRLVRGRNPAWPLAVPAVAAVLTWPFSGHEGSFWITVVTDAVHVGAMAVWLGGLAVLLAFLLRRATADELAAILPVWSGWALASVATLGIAGLVQAVVEVGTVGALLHTRYGLLLMAKVGVFAVILAAAAVARRSVRRATVPRTRLRRAVATELTLAAVVLGLTAVLVQTVPARAAVVRTQPPYSATLATKLFSLQVRIAPAAVGDNTVELTATTPDGKPLPVQEWFATASLPSRGVAPVTVPVRRLADDRAAATVTLPVAGRWRFRFALRVSEIDEAAVTGTVTVR